jgi:hypothetical protein
VTFQGLIVKHSTELETTTRGYGYFLLPELPTGDNGTTLTNTPKHSGTVIMGQTVAAP